MSINNTNSLKSFIEVKQQAKDNKIKPISKEYSLESIKAFTDDWKSDFIERMFIKSNSKRSNWDYRFARNCTTYFEPLDKLMIDYFDFLNKSPLDKIDYFKYCEAYFKGVELDIEYFRHDKLKLNEYYQRIDKERNRAKKENRKANPLFSRLSWERYVLFMMIKLNGLYRSEYDELFNVKEDKHREYNPLTGLRSVLRSVLPMKVKEYDIKQANPSFIFKELNIEPFDVYAKIMEDDGVSRDKSKTKFNSLINIHENNKNKSTINDIRNQLRPIYGDRVTEVITDERFAVSGLMQKDMAKHEKEVIKEFVKANNLKNYVRLHDGLFVLDSTECEVMEFGVVKFGIKQIIPPKVENNNILFYRFDTNKKGDDELIINPDLYSKFFEQEGFIRLSEESKDEVSIIKNENKIVNRYNAETDTPRYLTERINESCPVKISMIRNHVSTDSTRIKGGFKLLEGIPLKLHRDTKKAVFIPFANGVAEITADEVNMIDFNNDRIGFFMNCEPLNHNFEYSDEDADTNDFKDFICKAILGRQANDDDLTDKENNILTSFCSMIGYLVSNYKDPSETFAIILSDAGADEKSRRGGRGKSMIYKAISRVRPSITKQGESFKIDYTHKFGDVKKEHDIFFIDDTPSNFKYNTFYSEITGGLSAERKGTEAEQIPFEWTPKFVFTTNYAFRVNKDDSSTTRRFLEYQFTDYWSKKHQPKHEYKGSFFNDWDSSQWNGFYSFIVNCVQIFLNNGVNQIEYDKERDNYQAYFYNEIKEDIFKNVFSRTLKNSFKDGVYKFSTTDFWKEYESMSIEVVKSKFITYYTAGDHIKLYADYHQLKLERDERAKRWIYTGDINEDFNMNDDDSNVPF